MEVAGVVQGVGFRPFVYGLARFHGLGGFVRNGARGVVIEIEGAPAQLDAFAAALLAQAPPLARIASLETRSIEPTRESGHEFRIEVSDGASAGADARAGAGERTALIPADIATCDDCLRELFDPADRRHRYPFINCTNCGPRFTIVRGVPYDRAMTTMDAFEMCDECRREYEDPSDRRFHAEPICCPACGPRLSLDLAEAVALLRDGKILAVKGLGGYHLACDASNEEAVARLRERKRREEKPLAVMTAHPELLVELSPAEEALLRSAERPIVLARRLAPAPGAAAPDSGLAPSVAPGTEWLGVMLPYTPLHHLLCADFAAADTGGSAATPDQAALVMTSGNVADEPIAFDDDEARRRLGDITDAFLSHDRGIERRCEDSVVRAAFPIRRSRGYAPAALPLPVEARIPIVAAGAELKSTFCVVRPAPGGAAGDAFLSPHLGDLDTELAYRAFQSDLDLFLAMLGVEPGALAAIACDLHPDYLASKWARAEAAARDLPLHEIQHHHAHAAACLAENEETGPALALVLDGTGYGPDGTIWGGELLRADLGGFERLCHLEAVLLPGGEAAVREPWRVAAAYLERAERPVPSSGAFADWPRVRESLKVNAPLSSGAGRLFDAVAALLGVRERVSYEGQAAIALEQLAGHLEVEPYDCTIDGELIRGSDLVAAAHDDLVAGRDRAEVAAAFHEGLALVCAEACALAIDADGPGSRLRAVVLSGGCFQNLRLLAGVRRRLEERGFRVLTHRLLPPNDACISFGQAAVAAYSVGSRK